mgnify:CR=1 FL=1
MAGGADLVDGQEDRVGIAIDGDGADVLEMTRRFAFMPQFLAAAAVIPGVAAFDGALQGFGVHIGHHEDLAAASFLDDGRHEALFIKFNVFHRYTFHLFFCPSHGNSLSL